MIRENFRTENIEKIVLDSRGDLKNALFVAIKGEKTDGHKYIETAIKNGAVAVLVSEKNDEIINKYPSIDFYIVEDTVKALQNIGKMARDRFKNPLIAVTGSCGKTSARTNIAMALKASFNVYETAGNANSQLGVPISLYDMSNSNADIAVLETGMSEKGEMSKLADMVRPDMAVIINIGLAHIENLGTQENILKEKLCIIEHMKDEGVLFLCEDDPILKTITMDKIHSYGIAKDKNFDIRFYSASKYKEEFPFKANHMIENASLAMHVASYFKADIKKAKENILGFKGLKGRGEKTVLSNGTVIIDDSYNASPVSMKAGLKALSEEDGIKTAVLADMLELGENERIYHREIGEIISGLSITNLYLLGELSKEIEKGIDKDVLKGINIIHFNNIEDLEKHIVSNIKSNEYIYFKGSNSMRLSKIVDSIKKRI